MMDKEIMLDYINYSIESMKGYIHLDVLDWEYAKVRGAIEMMYCLKIISHVKFDKLNKLALNVMVKTKQKIESEMK